MSSYQRWILIFNIFFILATVVILALAYPHLPPQVPLFYSRPWGERQLAAPVFLAIFPFLSFLIFLLNTLLGRIFLSFPFLGAALKLSAAFFSGLILFDLIKIVMIII